MEYHGPFVYDNAAAGVEDVIRHMKDAPSKDGEYDANECLQWSLDSLRTKYFISAIVPHVAAMHLSRAMQIAGFTEPSGAYKPLDAPNLWYVYHIALLPINVLDGILGRIQEAAICGK